MPDIEYLSLPTGVFPYDQVIKVAACSLPSGPLIILQTANLTDTVLFLSYDKSKERLKLKQVKKAEFEDYKVQCVGAMLCLESTVPVTLYDIWATVNTCSLDSNWASEALDKLKRQYDFLAMAPAFLNHLMERFNHC